MRRSAFVVALFVLGTAVGAAAPASAVPVEDGDLVQQTSNGSSSEPRIDAIYPSPQTSGDDGEAVVLSLPEDALDGRWRLVDDDGHEAGLPNRTSSGTVAVSPEPDAADAVRSLADGIQSVAGRLRLANGGDRLALQAPNGTVLDRVSYDRAREGYAYVRTDRGWQWQRPDRTSFDPVRTEPSDATAFVLPDSPEKPVEALRSAERRILLGGYTLSSSRVVDALIDAHDDGVDVSVLLEGTPVGDVTTAQVQALDRLDTAGVDVTVLDGSPERYSTHHPKYAVVDDRALVLTENWKPAGTGGASSRGWGVLLRDGELASALAAVFHADANGSTGRPWSAARSSIEPVEAGPASGSFPERFEPRDVDVDAARLLLAPDNAERELTRLLGSANESIQIQQVSISGPDDPLLRAALDAARRGVAVDIVLDRAWYVEEENRRLATELRRQGNSEDLPLSVALVDAGSSFEKSHVKGVIVDDEHVVLGSLNWNPTALRENREVVVVLESESAAAFYADVFAADRPARVGDPLSGGTGVGPDRGTPTGFVATIAVAWLAFALVVAARVRWL